MLISFKRSQTGIVVRFKILDSSQVDGRGLAALDFESSGLIISTIADNEATATAYTVAGSNVEDISVLGTYQAPSSGKCRFAEVDATNHPGIYELHLANARYAVANAKSVIVSVHGATDAAQADFLIPLTDIDPYDAVRAGLTALPNAAAEASGGLLTRGTGTGQVNPSSGKIAATIAAGDIATDAVNAAALAADALAEINAEVDTALGDWGKTGFALSSSGLDAVVVAEPASTPAFGTSTIVQAIAGLLARLINKQTVNKTTGAVTVRNNADDATLWSHTATDDGTTATLGKAT